MHDLEIWRLRKERREIRIVVREATDPQGDSLGVELRVEDDGQIFLTERRQSKSDIEQRSAELLKNLEAVGWTALTSHRPH